MKDKIPVTLNDNHMYSCAINVIAYNNENDVSQLEITLDDRLLDYWVFIDFEKPDGTKIKTPKLNTIGNVATYVIPRSLVDQDGSLKAQIVLQNEEDVVWKSSIKTYRVKSSINATDDILEDEREDFITHAQRTLEEIENGLTPTIGENGNWFITGQDTGKPSQGEKGDKGDKGDAGSVKFIIANELPTSNIDVNVIYMIPSGETSEENTYKEYIYVNGNWESLGGASVNVDMTDYQKKTELEQKDLIVTYEDNTTETIKLVVYK